MTGESSVQVRRLWLGVLFLVLAGAYAFVKIKGSSLSAPLPIGPRSVVLAASAINTLIILIRVLTYPGPGPGSSIVGFGVRSAAGPAAGSWVILIAGVVATVFAALGFVARVGDVPDSGDVAEGGAPEV